MIDFPQVSVVIITYGHANFITQTLDGVLMQVYSGEIEVIIADDNSPDDTREVISSYLALKNSHSNFTIKYTKHKTNKGAIDNFSWALAQTSGKYVALCEGDDYWIDPLKLHKQVYFLENNIEYSLCFTAKSNIDKQGKFLSEARFSHQKNWTAEDVLDGGFIAGLQTIVSKNFSTEFNEFCNLFPQRTGADRLYTYFYGLKGKLKYLDFISAAYRFHDGGIWSALSDREKLTAHIKQHLIFLGIVAKNKSHYQSLKKNMCRLIIKNLYFKFFSKPNETIETLSFLSKNYKLKPIVFLQAGKDYLTYYLNILASKFKSI